ncbi:MULTISPECIES: dihydroorotate dehydrogenase electron transfer subunit [Gemella]|uniref:dihydroorotate dehydrogenase electron transfer subunit n=1 Tax=Gemella TaxID=1378 RepID=UPI000767E266|nr:MULTISPECIES: dihydroorotate dehydrogenase electron transfer subunit [Gemella]AME09197.1 dihydroorotate dehydrogenase electron transfer subunit [Gemella sp. oral taxon 928]AXI26830.1 dihydroorotate dehydrogenase electron transfer subunit [Gemella sp. ND 6198]
MQVQLVKVVENKKIADKIYKLTLEGSIVNEMNTAGQFVNIKVGKGREFLLRRPISICEINKEEQTFVIVYRVNGEGTKCISKLNIGEMVDVLGPLGKGYDITTLIKGETALLVGGGIGVPPLYELAKKFNEKGVKTIHVLGFNNEKDVFYKERFEKLGTTYVATADGTYGEKGFVTDIIKKYNIQYDKYYSCGPLAMLKALKNMDSEHIGYISLEERMACGVGACYACVCNKIDGMVSRVCYDGPVYKADEIAV